MYYYRFDPIQRLIEQCRSDSEFRARRTFGTEPYHPHHQIRSAMKTVSDGEGAFQISFWRNWESMRPFLRQVGDGSVIQRVRKDHEFFRHFERDVDEFLKKEAWFFWNVFRLEQPDVRWSPVGIPHCDIEVLHPDGRWLALDATSISEKATVPGWRISGYCVKPVIGQISLWTSEWTQQLHKSAVYWVVIRQPYGSIDPDVQQQVIAVHAEQSCVDPNSVRWVHARESGEDVYAEESFPTFLEHREPGLKGLWNRCCGQRPKRSWDIKFLRPPEPLPAAEIDRLYTALGLSDWLLRGKRWRYADHVL